MKSLGLQARGKRRFKATTNSAHDLPIAPNLLARNFTVDAPNKGNRPVDTPGSFRERAGYAAAATCGAGFQFQGSSSSRRLIL
jgi:transposase InsO family protein